MPLGVVVALGRLLNTHGTPFVVAVAVFDARQVPAKPVTCTVTTSPGLKNAGPEFAFALTVSEAVGAVPNEFPFFCHEYVEEGLRNELLTENVILCPSQTE